MTFATWRPPEGGGGAPQLLPAGRGMLRVSPVCVNFPVNRRLDSEPWLMVTPGVRFQWHSVGTACLQGHGPGASITAEPGALPVTSGITTVHPSHSVPQASPGLVSTLLAT